MKKYAEQIGHILKDKGIESAYNREDDSIYSIKESLFGDVYCIYVLKKGTISCFALYEHKVSSSSEDSVLLYLDKLNKLPGGGHFYIDRTLSCVTYCVDYEISYGTTSSSFERFCFHGYELYNQHCQVLFGLIKSPKEKFAYIRDDKSGSL